MNSRIAALLIVFAGLSGPAAAGPDERRPAFERGYNVVPDSPCLSDARRAALREELRGVERRLLEQGRIAPARAAHTLFIWPLRQSSALKEPNYWVTGTYLDENRAAGAQVDYMGGTRTYDNHTGNDTGSACFSWARQSMDATQIVAAEAGTILKKEDDAYDRSCGAQEAYNGIFIRHDDGSQSWYIHTKRKSLTAKAVGERVARGEYLGQMGSAGNSSGPHLHFEVYDAAEKLIDPYYGPSNTLNADSWWVKQKPYRDSAISLLLLTTADPVNSPCPVVEITHAVDGVRPGQLVKFFVYYRDTDGPQKAEFKILRPDGSVFQRWDVAIDVKWDVLVHAWSWYLPGEGPVGAWKFQGTYCGKTLTKPFTVTKKPAPMKITGLTPSKIKAGATTEVRISGAAFKKGCGVAIHKSFKLDDKAVYVRSVEYKSSTLLVAEIEAGAEALKGGHLLVVTRPDFVQAVKNNALTVIR